MTSKDKIILNHGGYIMSRNDADALIKEDPDQLVMIEILRGKFICKALDIPNFPVDKDNYMRHIKLYNIL